MGDGIKAMYDDYDDYVSLCEKHGQRVLLSMHSNYSVHENWIKAKFEDKTTELTWEQWNDNYERDLIKRKIERLRYEAQLLEDSLS